MANFGWAYIDCTSSANANIYGPTGSLLFLSGSQAATGSQNLIYYTASAHSYAASTLVLTGALLVSGAITASNMLVESITRIDATGSTYFGDTNDDIHMRTGSLYMVGTTAGTGDLYVSGSTTLGGSLSSSNTAIVVGNTVLGSALNVSGNVTLANQISSSAAPFGAILAGHILTSAKIKATGSISGSSTLESVGAATIGGDLYVSGATILADAVSSSAAARFGGSLSSSGDLAVTGAVHAANFYGNGSGLTGILDASAGADNRVAVFADGDTITGNPDFEFDSTAAMVTIGGTVTTGISASGPATFVGNTVLGNALSVSGNVTLANQISSSAAPFGAILAGHILTSAKIKATGSISGSSTLESVGAATIGGDLYVSGATTLGDSISDNHKMSGSLSVYRDNSNVVLAVDPNTYTTTVMGLNVKYENITTTLQTSSEASYIIGINAGDSDTDYCVMSASTAGIGKLLVIKDEVTSRSGTKIYVSASARDTIDGAAYYIITGSMASINLYSDGVNKWFIF